MGQPSRMFTDKSIAARRNADACRIGLLRNCMGERRRMGGVPIVLSTDFPRLIPQIGNADAEPAYGLCGSYEEAAGYAEYGTLSLMIA